MEMKLLKRALENLFKFFILQEILKEFEKRQFLTSSNLTDSNSQFTERNFVNNNLSNNNATWQKNLSQPRQQPQLQTQQSYSQQDQPLPQPPALYAVPIPRSQRSRLNDLYTSSPRTPTSSVNSGHSQTRQQMPEPIYSNEAIQNLVDTLTEEFANENVQSYLEGTTTFFIVGSIAAFCAAAFGQGVPTMAAVAIAVGAAAFGALAELFSQRVDDNLTVPLAAMVGAVVAASLVGLPL